MLKNELSEIIASILEEILPDNQIEFTSFLIGGENFHLWSTNKLKKLMNNGHIDNSNEFIMSVINFRSEISRLLDNIPRGNIFRQTGSKLWEQYELFLNMSEIVDVDKIINLEYSSPGYKIFEELQESDNTDDKIKSHSTFFEVEKNKVLKFEANTNKERVSYSVYRIWQYWKSKYENSDTKNVDFNKNYFARFHADFESLLSDDWTILEFDKDELLRLNDISSITNNKKHTSKYLKKVSSLSMEYKTLKIERPWFSPDSLSADFWKFKKGYQGEIVSDGFIKNKNKLFPGIIPSYTNEFIFIKNVYVEKLFGPLSTFFSTIGTLFTGQSDYLFQNNYNNSDTFYLVGFKCIKVPKSPNTNPNLTFYD